PDVEHLGTGLERAAHVLDRGRVGVELDADHVEARIAIVPAARGDELLRDPRHLRALAAVDRLERRAGPRPAPAPHLDEDQHRPAARPEVAPPGAAGGVASHDRVLEGTEESFRHCLAPPPDLTPPIHGARIYSPVLALARHCERRGLTRNPHVRQDTWEG